MSTHTVTVTGHGTTSVRPDSAVVRVAGVARAAGVAEAFGGCSAAAAAIGGVARRHTGEERVATTGINVWPWHDNQGQPRGFEARHSMSIVCPDLDAAGALLDELTTEIGDALVVEGVALEVSSPTAAHEQAVAAAYDDAVRQATQLAGLAGASLGEVLAIGHAGPAGDGTGHHRGAMMSAKIEPGETTVGANLTVTWSLVREA
ncbi:MAG: hypothetical protein JWN68_1036 [Nocardioides sp.]|jgi:uncharacterized protein YggE|uniref:SIMPL domain-containing protein n=1 Tax=Nocardioides sp. TaxID=35761 RepID=UPI002616E593|nr:SIMPL domain-containing protein [Nocardioides sp.]MCW2833083.1 hypothetical protein [Nocardioides sp.]